MNRIRGEGGRFHSGSVKKRKQEQEEHERQQAAQQQQQQQQTQTIPRAIGIAYTGGLENTIIIEVIILHPILGNYFLLLIMLQPAIQEHLTADPLS